MPCSGSTTWYTKLDYRRFNHAIKGDAAFARQDHSTTIEAVTGIVIMISPRILDDVLSKRELHKQAVLEEQERQLNEGICDLEVLMMTSQIHSEDAKELALIIARRKGGKQGTITAVNS